MKKIYFVLLFFTLFVSTNAYANPYTIEIDLIARELSLLSSNSLVKKYPIAVPMSKKYITPLGEYKIIEKDNAPGWQHPYNKNIKIPPGPRNPLGTRWMGFIKTRARSYGIHGTNAPRSIGTMASHGCIRMQIKDSEELYKLVSIGTPVKVKYDRFIIQNRDGDIAMKINADPYGIEPLTIENIKKHILAQFPNAKLNENTIKYLSTNGAPGQTRLVGFIEKSTGSTKSQDLVTTPFGNTHK